MGKIPFYYSLFACISTAAGLLALSLPLGVWVRAGLALVWLFSAGYMLGQALMAREAPWWRFFFGTLGFAAAVISLGSAAYFLFRLDLIMTALVVGVAPFLAAMYAGWAAPQHVPFGIFMGANAKEPEDRKTLPTLLRALLGGIACVGVLALVWRMVMLISSHASDAAIRSPWDTVPATVFGLFFLAALVAFTAASSGFAPRAALFASGAIAALAASVATLSYSVGFGFDPFLHRATEQVIFSTGAIDPKPFYYLGQYALVTLVARFLGGNVSAIDAAIVPVSLALVLPCAYYGIRRGFGLSRGAAAAGALAILALPLASFAATTPQGFADTIFLMAACTALAAGSGEFPFVILALLGVAATAIHPIAGLPLILFMAILRAVQWSSGTERRLWRRAIPFVLGLIGMATIPALFALQGALSGSGAAIDAEQLQNSGSVLEAFQRTAVPTRRFDLFLDFTYAWKASRALAIILAAAAGLWLCSRRSTAWLAWLLGGLTLIGNYVLMKTLVQFPFLIAYERSSYADRLFELTLFLAAPLMCVAVAWAIERSSHSTALVRVSFAALAAAVLTASLYLAYPRRDRYESSRGWSTSAADVETVRSIDRDAGGAQYVVLSNQALAAAAVRELGFRTYFQSHDPAAPAPIFFYPIPTGGPLYERFLAMNAALGARAEAERAMDLAGVHTAYYVVAFYWWDAQRITITARRESDKSWTVDDKNHVFKYVRR